MEEVIRKATSWARNVTSRFQTANDFSHVQRVLKLAKVIEVAETEADSTLSMNGDVITLAALLHNVGDKPLEAGENVATLVASYLKSIDCPRLVADKVQLICSNVSYEKEQGDPHTVSMLCSVIPELRIIQDAARLDSMGAVGVMRTFPFTGARLRQDVHVAHFREQLPNLKDSLKTGTGKALAKPRLEFMKLFLNQWDREHDTVVLMSHINGMRRERAEQLERDEGSILRSATSQSQCEVTQNARHASEVDEDEADADAADISDGDTCDGDAFAAKAMEVLQTKTQISSVLTGRTDHSHSCSRSESRYSPSQSSLTSAPESTATSTQEQSEILAQATTAPPSKRKRQPPMPAAEDRLSKPRRSVSNADVRAIDSPPVVTDWSKFERRPLALGKKWSCSEANFHNMTRRRRRTYTHVALMTETSDGMVSSQKCIRCFKKGYVCLVYRPEVKLAYTKGNNRAVEKCAHCRFVGQLCEFDND